MNGLVEESPAVGLGKTETPKSEGAVIKMAALCGDEKACLALWVH